VRWESGYSYGDHPLYRGRETGMGLVRILFRFLLYRIEHDRRSTRVIVLDSVRCKSVITVYCTGISLTTTTWPWYYSNNSLL